MKPMTAECAIELAIEAVKAESRADGDPDLVVGVSFQSAEEQRSKGFDNPRDEWIVTLRSSFQAEDALPLWVHVNASTGDVMILWHR